MWYSPLYLIYSYVTNFEYFKIIEEFTLLYSIAPYISNTQSPSIQRTKTITQYKLKSPQHFVVHPCPKTNPLIFIIFVFFPNEKKNYTRTKKLKKWRKFYLLPSEHTHTLSKWHLKFLISIVHVERIEKRSPFSTLLQFFRSFQFPFFFYIWILFEKNKKSLEIHIFLVMNTISA